MVDVKATVSKEEWETRVDLAAFYRTVPYFGWDDLIFTHISAKVPGADNHFLINGFRERSCFDAARGRGLIKDLWLALNFYRIIGTNAYVCKPNTAFTKEWMASINNILDQKYELLTHNPAEHPRDFYCKKFDDGHVSNYPLRWTEICGEVFHPLCLKYSKEILKSLPAPAFHESYL